MLGLHRSVNLVTAVPEFTRHNMEPRDQTEMSVQLQALTAFTLEESLIINQDWSRRGADENNPHHYREKSPGRQ